MRKKPIFIFVSGGVISGLGKGITTASIALLLKSRGFKVAPVKCDAYVNIDAGTIRPQEHGEVFVCDDGIETDQDLGNYERFIDESLTRANYITTGQVYQEIIRKERAFEYKGEDVEVVPHVPEEMIRRFRSAGEKMDADFILMEIGGTVGEYQNVLFLEANRILKLREKEKVLHVHVGYLPTPPSLGEMKSKPVQTSVRILNETGIHPDFIIGRAEKPLDKWRKDRLAFFCNVDGADVISNPDVKSIYEVPLILEEQNLTQKILKKVGLRQRKTDLIEWRKMVEKVKKIEDSDTKIIKVGIIGKYQKIDNFNLSDSYISVLQAIKHAAWHLGRKPEVIWINSEDLEEGTDLKKALSEIDALIVPGGFGSRGVEGMIRGIGYARENIIPYLGLCYGMQLATAEFGRSLLGFEDANTTEVNPKAKYPVIHLMPEQEKKMLNRDYGATMRLGSWTCKINKGTQTEHYYEKYHWLGEGNLIEERHRHRFEFNNEYRDKFEKAGMIIAGTTPDDKLVEIVELPGEKHPFFVGVQFHPEFKSRFLKPHPLFLGLLEKGEEYAKSKN